MLTVTAFDHIVLNVRDVEVSASWYARVLGMRRQTAVAAAGGAPRTAMVFGRNKINLRPIDVSQDEWFTADVPQTGSADLCFLTDDDPETVAAHFRTCGVEIVSGPVDKQGAQGPIRSVYVRDPDGSLIEVSSYPDEPAG